MEEKSEDKTRVFAMYRRWAYMAIALIATILIPVTPVFRFQPDKGVVWERTYEMDMKTFVVTQTVLDYLDEETKAETPAKYVAETVNVSGLHIFQRIMFWAIIACFFLFYPTNLRMYMSVGIILIAAIFYFLLVYYSIRISDYSFATLTPTWVTAMPGVVIAMMVLLYRNVMRYGNYFDEISEE